MKQTKPKAKGQKKAKAAKPFPWRKVKGKWTDTLFDKKLLQNPFLMTNVEVARALREHQEWRTSYGKYNWEMNPAKENKEDQPPFSPHVLTSIIWEAIVRLQMSGENALGRFKFNVCRD